MTFEKSITKVLPKSSEETEITVKSNGDDGGDIEIDVDMPSPHDVSDRTKDEYSSHRWTGAGKFWHETLEEAIDEYEVKSRTYKTNSGNVGLTSCYIELDYYDEANVEGIVETLLRKLDQTIMAEQRNQMALEKRKEAAQEQVGNDLISRIEDIELN